MILGIDASNIFSGGGANHLLELLSKEQLNKTNINKIIIWSSRSFLDIIPNNKYFVKKTSFFLNKSLMLRIFWQIFILSSELKQNKCDVVFLPGASIVLTKIPKVSMCQNLLPFSWIEIKKFGFSLFTLKLILLMISQSICFMTSDGIIFLSKFSKKHILDKINLKSKKTKIIYHGVSKEFFNKVQKQYSIKDYSHKTPYKFLYVSHLWPYKNHSTIIKSIATLKQNGYPVIINIVGGAYAPTLKKISKMIKKVDPENNFIFYHENKNIKEIINYYHTSDALIFGSSCETFGQIITEAMLSGLPIICSKESSMQEILNNTALYYNPLCENELTKVIKTFVTSVKLRSEISKNAQQRAKTMTWSNCAEKTYSFISEFNKINY